MLPVFQIKDTKSDSRKSCLGKQLANRRKWEEKQSTKENKKREGTNF